MHSIGSVDHVVQFHEDLKAWCFAFLAAQPLHIVEGGGEESSVIPWRGGLLD